MASNQLIERTDSRNTVGETSSRNLIQYEVEKRKRAELKRLELKLRVLEEEAVILKGALLESVRERTTLITEVYEHLETLQHYLMQNKVQEEKCTHGGDIASFGKDRRAGLLQVLCKESNPWLVKQRVRGNPFRLAGTKLSQLSYLTRDQNSMLDR